MDSQSKIHVPVLDNLRAIAALSVCVYHFVCGPVNFITSQNILNVFEYGAYGVQFFFVISGFIIPWSLFHNKFKIQNYFRFLLKRFVRLEPPYLFSIILVLLLIWLRNFYAVPAESKLISLKQIAFHLGYFIPFSDYKWLLDVYWTLAIEFQFYLFVGLFYFILVNKKNYLRYCGYVFLLLLFFSSNKNFLPYWLPVFLLGMLLFLFKLKKISQIEFYFVSVFTLFFIAIIHPYPVFVSSLLSFILILFFFNYSNLILNWLGKISYSIYLFHTIVGTTIINVLSHYVQSVYAKIGVVLIGVLASLVVSAIMYRFIEKPSKNLASKIKY